LSEGAAKPAFQLLIGAQSRTSIANQLNSENSQRMWAKIYVYRRSVDHKRSAKRRVSRCECSKSIPSRIDHEKKNEGKTEWQLTL